MKKRIISIILASVMFFAMIIPVSVSAAETGIISTERLQITGDANNDGKVTIIDVTIIQQILVGTKKLSVLKSILDFDGDGEITIDDATLIQRWIAGYFCPNRPQDDTNRLTENIRDGAILHCFSWDFETITNSLEDIAAAGFSTIQTSPINECLVGDDGQMQLYGNGKWFYHYQPTDYKIGNYQLGTRDEFKTMCEKADKLGIKVIVDVVANHTTPTTSAINKNLSDAAGGMDKLFHKGSSKDIANYGDRLQCTTYKMGGLPDINTENKAFQDYFINYLNDCISCGADGFRYDAARHIGLPDDPRDSEENENNFWPRVTSEINDADRIFNYGEVLEGKNNRAADYIDAIGACTASAYGSAVRSAVINCNVDAKAMKDMQLDGKTNAVTWVESHDNYINDRNWTAMDTEQIKTGWAIIAARASGTPLFFDRPYGTAIDDQWGSMNRIGASGDMFYKDDAVRAVNFFRNAMSGEDEAFYNPNGDASAIEICRGKKGAVIVNTEGELKVDFACDLADGTYIDRVNNETVYTVKHGRITCDTPIKEYQTVVLYNDGYMDTVAPATVKVDDKVHFTLEREKLIVKLEAVNADTATYAINDGEEIAYENGDKVVIKAKDAQDGMVTLTLRGKNPEGKSTYMKYYFTVVAGPGDPVIAPDMDARTVEAGDTVTFEKPKSWDSKVYAYVYGNDTMEAAWPGLEMEKLDDDTYQYTFRGKWENGYIIFSDGKHQFPPQSEPGIIIVKDGKYMVPA